MQARLPALQAPVLADRRLGERSACADREQRERAQRLVLARRRRLEDVFRDHALDQVVLALEALASGDRQLAAVPERLEHHLRRLPVPHAAATAVAFEVARAEGAFRADPLEHGLDELGVLADRPVVCAPVSGACHHRAEVRPQLDRQQRRLVCPVLEDAAGAEERRDRVLGERPDPRRDRQPVRAVDGADRVELHRSQAPDHVLDLVAARTAEARREPLAADDEPPDRDELDRRHAY